MFGVAPAVTAEAEEANSQRARHWADRIRLRVGGVKRTPGPCPAANEAAHTAFIQKPFSAEGLAAKVREVLDGP